MENGNTMMSAVGHGASRPVSFKKSSRCAGNGACVEVAIDQPGRQVWVRDSKDPAADRVLSFTAGAWQGFVADIETGQFLIG
jgi:hypothetical protein